jgi:tetratricopeptide (TPR) repeat protein
MKKSFCLAFGLFFINGAAFASDNNDVEAAMRLARAHHYADALPMLEKLHNESPNDVTVTGDYLTVLDWAHYDDKALALYQSLHGAAQPDYVMLAGAHAYYMTGQTGKALALYREGVKLYPENQSFGEGVSRCLAKTQTVREKTQTPASKKPAKTEKRQARKRAIKKEKQEKQEVAEKAALIEQPHTLIASPVPRISMLSPAPYAAAIHTPSEDPTERQSQISKMASFELNASLSPSPSTDIQGGASYGIEAVLRSALIGDHWRIFADDSYAHEDEAPGAVAFNQSAAGVEYYGSQLTVTAAPTENVYHGSDRAGFTTSGDWRFNDSWSAGGKYASFSRDTPLQALNAGVTASKVGVDAVWAQDDNRELRFDASDMQFSDDNNRVGAGVVYLQKLFVSPSWRVDAVLDTGLTHDSESQNSVDYFNPRADFTGLIGPKVTQARCSL